jgi:hypothetical protein
MTLLTKAITEICAMDGIDHLSIDIEKEQYYDEDFEDDECEYKDEEFEELKELFNPPDFNPPDKSEDCDCEYCVTVRKIELG